MFRSLTGTIGAALLGGAALLVQPQEQGSTEPAAPAPSATAQGVHEQQCYTWVKALTGIDPQAPATAAAQTEQRAAFKKAVGTCLQARASF
jgi:hypothetical protein